jgi:hypothetical protein
VLERLLRDHYGLELGYIERRQQDGPDRRLTAALSDLCTRLLANDRSVVDDRQFRRWQRRRRATKWIRERLWEAAEIVGYVRTIGYDRKAACAIVQNELYREQLEGKDSLYRILCRAKRDGAFGGHGKDKPPFVGVSMRFNPPTRIEAHGVLAALGMHVPDDGPEPELPADIPLW